MPSVLDALWAGMQPVFDAAMGEPIIVEPKPAGDGRRLVIRSDAAGQPFPAVGIFRDAMAVDRAPRPTSRDSEAPDVLVGKTTADFATAQFMPDTLPREGWTLVLSSRPSAPRYAIGVVKPDGVARIWCGLTFRENTA